MGRRKAKAAPEAEAGSVTSVRASVRVSIPPWQLGDVDTAIRTAMHALLFRYSPGLDAVVLAVSDVEQTPDIKPTIAPFVPVVNVTAHATFLLFRPRENHILHGVVTKVGSDYVAVKTLGVFTASIAAADVDASRFANAPLEPGLAVNFVVKEVSHEGGYFTLTGALDRPSAGPVPTAPPLKADVKAGM